MAYSAFLSHSMAPEDESIVRGIAEHLGAVGVQCYVAERDWQPGQNLAAKIEQAIRACDCLIAILTRGGSQSQFVNQEIGFAVASGKLVIPVVERGVDVRGFRAGVEWVELDRQNPQALLPKLAPHIVRLAAAKDRSNLIGLAILAALGFWLLKSG